MVCLSRPYPFKLFKGCLPQILLGPFLNALSQFMLCVIFCGHQKWMIPFLKTSYEFLTPSNSCCTFKVQSAGKLNVHRTFRRLPERFQDTLCMFNWDKVFKNGRSKTCEREPLKNLKGYVLLKQTTSLQTF